MSALAQQLEALPLHSRTPLEWGEAVLREPIALLIDHAFLEKKAANNAMDLMTRWPDDWLPGWVETMTSVARDEAAHLAQVTRILIGRGGRLARTHKNPYANDLRLLVRRGEIGDLIDRLFVSALIESRSCERFAVLAAVASGHDEELASFYNALFSSELGHYKVLDPGALLENMNQVLQFVGPKGAVQLFGVKLVGINGENGKKLLFSLAYIAIIWLLGWGIGALVRVLIRKRSLRVAFWIEQAIHLLSAAMLLIGVCSIWFNDPTRLATAFGLVTAGLAFALQRVITALAAYIVILRGKTFNVGDRIVMGGVRGDVVDLGFIQTTIMEMGQPPSVQSADPAMWVKARQYTGRIVTLTNDKIFDSPVFNYTRDFPFIWEEMSIPITYQAALDRAEEILLAAAQKLTTPAREIGDKALSDLQRRFFMMPSDLEPRVFVRLTDNWVELTVRFITTDHGIRDVKDRMSREILQGFNQAGIGVASSTYDIVGMPPLTIKMDSAQS